MAIVELKINRYGQEVRVIDTNKVARQIIERWVDHEDGEVDSLIRVLDQTLKDIVIQLCDA